MTAPEGRPVQLNREEVRQLAASGDLGAVTRAREAGQLDDLLAGVKPSRCEACGASCPSCGNAA